MKHLPRSRVQQPNHVSHFIIGQLCFAFTLILHGRLRVLSSETLCYLLREEPRRSVYFGPPFFSHANAEAPPTGFADRGLASGAWFSFAFSADTVRFA